MTDFMLAEAVEKLGPPEPDAVWWQWLEDADTRYDGPCSRTPTARASPPAPG